VRGRGWTGALVASQPPLRQIVRGWCVVTPYAANTIRDAFNVSSVTDGGTGLLTITWAVPFFYAAGATGYAVVATARGQGLHLNTHLDPTVTLGNMYTNAFVRTFTTVVGGASTDASVYSLICFGA